MKFIIGIGNEDRSYQDTRHNVGFKVVDWIQAHSKLTSKAARWSKSNDLKALVAKWDESSFLVKSKLFVNNTGATVSMIRTRNPEVGPGDYLFVCDDVNLKFGKMRLRLSGSAGGHHGLESVIGTFGSENFPRLRIGVGTDCLPEDLTDFVLQNFSSEEEKELKVILEKAALVCESWLKDGFQAAQDKLSQLQS